MKFVFERMFFAERSENLEQSEKFFNLQLSTFNYGYKKLR